MSEISDLVTATIIVADFINIDAANKVNVIGGGIQFIGFDPQQGTTSPFAIFVQVHCPLPAPEMEAALEVVLADASGNPVLLPGPTGEGQAMRVAQNIEFRDFQIPGTSIPRGAVPAGSQVVLNFGNGLPLAVSQSYQWRVHIDHELKASYSFYIPGPPPGPVIG